VASCLSFGWLDFAGARLGGLARGLFAWRMRRDATGEGLLQQPTEASGRERFSD
jgi:hypothetical protein